MESIVFTLPNPFPVSSVNVFLFEGDELTLVDTGPKTRPAWETLQKSLSEHGHSVGDIRRVIITHAHVDHFGLAARIVAQSGAKVLTHKHNFHFLKNFREAWGRRGTFVESFLSECGVPDKIVVELLSARYAIAHYADPLEADTLLEESDILEMNGRLWQVLHTPGHAYGLICLYEPKGHHLLSSDHLLSEMDSIPMLESIPGREDKRRPSMSEYINSLERIAGLELSTVLPGHGKPVVDARELIDHRLYMLGRRRQRILKILARGQRNVFEITAGLFRNLTPLGLLWAVSEVIGHLDILEDDGLVYRSRAQGIFYFCKSSG